MYQVALQKVNSYSFGASLYAATDAAPQRLAACELPPPPPDHPGATAAVPAAFSLAQNYPNPFNPTTTIEFDLPQASKVTIEVFNLLGQEVRTLVKGMTPAGRHVAMWDSRDNFGGELTSGLYILRFGAAGHTFIGKLMRKPAVAS